MFRKNGGGAKIVGEAWGLVEIARLPRGAVCSRASTDYLLNENRLLYQLPMFGIARARARIKPADRPADL